MRRINGSPVVSFNRLLTPERSCAVSSHGSGTEISDHHQNFIETSRLTFLAERTPEGMEGLWTSERERERGAEEKIPL